MAQLSDDCFAGADRMISTAEALSLLAGEFAAAIREERPPLTDGPSGERIVRLLEAAEKSIKNGGGTESL